MKNKKAVAVLTRGYESIFEYDKLIKRNECVSNNLENKNEFDILIFHEGNISTEHQELIKGYTTELNISFIDVHEKGMAFRKSKETTEVYPPTQGIGMGYRHMCSFWFVDFWHYTQDYDYIMRIDEDCEIECSIDNIFYNLPDYSVMYGTCFDDAEWVTHGLNKFTLDFLGDDRKSKNPYGPYTNGMAFNLKILRENQTLKKYIKEVDDSNNIYIYRWGDLPLWGEALHYMVDPRSIREDKSIKYYHESHDCRVNQ